MKKCNYELFSTVCDIIPSLIHEIGRQREIIFRKVGEGSNKSLDGLIFLELAEIPNSFINRICSQEEPMNFDCKEISTEFQIA